MDAKQHGFLGLLNEPWDQYHARGDEFVSAHSLKTFRRCPLEFIMERRGELPQAVDRPALAFGRAAHTLILEGEAKLQEEYAVDAPINKKTGKPYGRDSRAYAEWLEAQGRPAISPDELELLTRMRDSVENHGAACRLLGEGYAEKVIRRGWLGVPCQSRLDWICPAGIADLKTCDDLDLFERDLIRYEYKEQLGFYAGVADRAGVQVPAGYLIAVEKRAPNRCGVWKIGRESLDVLIDRIGSELMMVAEAFRTGKWETKYEHVRILGQ